MECFLSVLEFNVGGPWKFARWMSRNLGQRKDPEISIANVIFASSITLLPLFLSFLPEFTPPQVVYSRDLVSLLFAPWTSPSSTSRVLSRLLQSLFLFRLPKNTVLPCYLLWITIALTRTLVGFLLSRSVGWAYPRLFNHWAFYESSGGCGPPLVAYMITSGMRPDFTALLPFLRGYRWEVTEPFALLIGFALLATLDYAPWTYGIGIGLALLVVTFRAACPALYPPEGTYTHLGLDVHHGFPAKRFRADIQTALSLLAFILLSNFIFAFLTSPSTTQMPSSPRDGAPFLEIVLLSYPRPNDTPSSPDQASILSQTISSYLPYVSPFSTLSVFTHVALSKHPSFSHAQQFFQDAPVTFYVDEDTHPEAYPGQHLHLAEAFRWLTEKPRDAEWVMLVEDDFPLCGEWGWQGVVRVMQALARGHRIPSPDTTKMWGGFVGTGGRYVDREFGHWISSLDSGLILHRTLLPILAQTLRMHALTRSAFPAFMKTRPADIIVQDCLLGFDPMCPTATSSKDAVEGIWFTRKRPTMVITSRLVMDHIGGSASTAKGRTYDPNKWRCGWRHPFHGRPEVTVVPV